MAIFFSDINLGIIGKTLIFHSHHIEAALSHPTKEYIYLPYRSSGKIIDRQFQG